eukprot:scaffold9519_cov145-Skeletonema_dohrnii-CCMP3373.AAC.2
MMVVSIQNGLNNSGVSCYHHGACEITDRMGVATRLPPKYDRGGLLRGSRVCSSCHVKRC